MKKNKSPNKTLIILVVLALTFVIILILALRTNNNTTTPPSQTNTSDDGKQMKQFQSKDLKFVVIVPQDFTIKSSTTGVDLIKNGASIEIVRNGTQFLTLSEYLNNFDNRRDIEIKTSENINISGHKTLIRNEKRIIGKEIKNIKAYYIWIDGIIYIISTSSPSLFSALDQIAQSFRYTP